MLNLRWSHTITGKLQVIVGGGPEYSILEYGGRFPSWYFSGRATLRYRFEHSALSVSCGKIQSQGEGLFAGADTQMVRGTYQRPVRRTDSLYAYVGYVRENRLQSPAGFGYTFGSFDSWIAGIIFRNISAAPTTCSRHTALIKRSSTCPSRYKAVSVRSAAAVRRGGRLLRSAWNGTRKQCELNDSWLPTEQPDW